MKTLSGIILAFLLVSIPLAGQQLFTDQHKDSVVRIDPRMQQYDIAPGEILVKFRDPVKLSIHKSGGNIKTGLSGFDEILLKASATEMQKLFPEAKQLKSKQILTAVNGSSFERPSLHNIYKIKLKTTGDLFQTIEALKADSTLIEYAEPNYILSITDDQPVGDIIVETDNYPSLREDHDLSVETDNYPSLHQCPTPFTPNDPLYSQQWYIPAIKADSVWQQTTGDSTQIIAILDTGVDWTHPDLVNKIWQNTGEIAGNGIDDDYNGKIDDIRGWDWINNDNNPMDDNSHGTHVAGIAAAEANNGIGIAGVCPEAKIMVLKVFQSSGRGDASTISQGIIYASTHGAAAINMSFGSYARSLTMETSLANAYADCILVAAAGNDGIAIGPCMGCAPFFPAALSFVLGVQSPEAGFSNNDQDGPTFSLYSDLLNYEMKAPGTNALSTIPGGGYRVYQGTSMATPAISAALCLYRKLIPQEDETNEFMWVKLIQATEQWLNINKALTIVPKPEVWFLNNIMVDTLGTDDRDGRVDAGETIQLWFHARNTGGQVDSVYWKIQMAEFEDTTTCKILKPTSFLGSISPYATRTSETDPMIFHISPKVVHDRDITFDLFSWFKGSADTVKNKVSSICFQNNQ